MPICTLIYACKGTDILSFAPFALIVKERPRSRQEVEDRGNRGAGRDTRGGQNVPSSQPSRR